MRNDRTTIGIDAVNLRSGGAIRHLVELLAHVELSDHGFRHVVVWANPTLEPHLKPSETLTVVIPKTAGNVLTRELWRLMIMPSKAKRTNCAIIFSPGGNPLFRFCPWVAMSQNLLPFDDVRPCKPIRRNRNLRVKALRFIQTLSFSRATGVIFLSLHAQTTILHRIKNKCAASVVVPFGISPGFNGSLKVHPPGKPFRWVYLSTIDYYKCQIEAVEATTLLLDRGMDVTLDFVGGGASEEKDRLLSSIPENHRDRFKIFSVASDDVAETLTRYDAALFLSMCESHPNALIECVASALPVVANDHGSIREVVQDESVRVSALDPTAIASGMERLMNEYEVRTVRAHQTALRLHQRSWDFCAAETLSFLRACVDIEPDWRRARPNTPGSVWESVVKLSKRMVG